jgi:hypothetical protein
MTGEHTIIAANIIAIVTEKGIILRPTKSQSGLADKGPVGTVDFASWS